MIQPHRAAGRPEPARTALTLPTPGLRRGLAAAVQGLAGFGAGPPEVWLGGGSVLVARWGHRASDRIDLFAEMGLFWGLQKIGHERILDSLLDAGARRIRIELAWISWETGDGPGGFWASAPSLSLGGHLSGQADPVHGLRAERTASILAKKVFGRMLGAGTILQRDLTDIVACERHEPDELTRALGLLSRHQRRVLAAEMESARRLERPAWQGRPGWPEREERWRQAARIMSADVPEAMQT